MFWILLALFTLVPLGEVVLLLRVKDAVGFGPTVGLVLLTGVVGAALARWQGVRTLRRIQTELGAGKLPAQALFDGALIVLAGAVLLTPGIMTDCVGFSLLIPQVRRFFGRLARDWAAKRFQLHGAGGVGQPEGTIDAEVVASRPAEPPPVAGLTTEAPGEVIDVEPTPRREEGAADP